MWSYVLVFYRKYLQVLLLKPERQIALDRTQATLKLADGRYERLQLLKSIQSHLSADLTAYCGAST